MKIAILLSVVCTLLVIPSQGLEIPQERLEMFARMLRHPQTSDAELKEMREKGLTESGILDELLEAQEYSILEAALSTKDLNNPYSIIEYCVPRMPEEEKKRFLISALLNPIMWPSDGEIPKLRLSSGNIQDHHLQVQEMVIWHLSKVFERQIPRSRELWTSAQRAALAETMRPQYTARAPSTGTHFNTDPLSENKDAQQNDERRKRFLAILAENEAERDSRTPFAWMKWSGIGVSAGAIAVLLVIRILSRRKSRRTSDQLS